MTRLAETDTLQSRKQPAACWVLYCTLCTRGCSASECTLQSIELSRCQLYSDTCRLHATGQAHITKIRKHFQYCILYNLFNPVSSTEQNITMATIGYRYKQILKARETKCHKATTKIIQEKVMKMLWRKMGNRKRNRWKKIWKKKRGGKKKRREKFTARLPTHPVAVNRVSKENKDKETL